MTTADPTASLDLELTRLKAADSDQAARITVLEATTADHGQRIAILEQKVAALNPPPITTPPPIVTPPPVVTPPPTTTPVDKYKPVSYPSLDAALAAGLGDGRAKSTFVVWPADAPANWDLESQFRKMSNGQVLVLPERAAPYPIISDYGFVAAGVAKLVDTSLPAGSQEIPMAQKWNGQTPRTWFAMTRAALAGGILGLGPGAVIEPTKSTFTRPKQGKPSQLSYVSTAGVSKSITGCQEKLIEGAGGDTYFANFTLRGRDFGEVAYNGITTKDVVVERVHFDRCWRGFDTAPNGETGALACGTPKKVKNSTFTCTGTGKPKTSVIMANWSNASLLEEVWISDDATGGVTYWNSNPNCKVIWRNCHFPSHGNLEANQAGFELLIEGGEHGASSSHLGMYSPNGSQKVTFRGVKNISTLTKWVIGMWGAAPYTQLKSDVTAFDANGNPQVVSVVGNVAG